MTPTSLKDAAADFLAQERLAVAGVSRSPGEAANAIYRKLCDSGHRVFAVNPNADQVEGDRCYPDLGAVPEGVDGVVVATHPRVAAEVVRQAADAGVPRVWLHRSFGQGSVSDDAVAVARERGLSVIPGACPMMFCAPVDPAHRCIRWFLGLTGGLPEPTPAADAG